jgi:hypothetical protein
MQPDGKQDRHQHGTLACLAVQGHRDPDKNGLGTDGADQEPDLQPAWSAVGDGQPGGRKAQCNRGRDGSQHQKQAASAWRKRPERNASAHDQDEKSAGARQRERLTP